MVMTEHALERWAERFRNLDYKHEFSLSRKPKKKELCNIRAQCPDHAHLIKYKGYKGMMYLISPSKVVFVCNINEIVVTVFPYVARGDKVDCASRQVYLKGRRMRKNEIKNKW